MRDRRSHGFSSPSELFGSSTPNSAESFFWTSMIVSAFLKPRLQALFSRRSRATSSASGLRVFLRPRFWALERMLSQALPLAHLVSRQPLSANDGRDRAPRARASRLVELLQDAQLVLGRQRPLRDGHAQVSRPDPLVRLFFDISNIVTFLQLAPYFNFRSGNCLSHVGTQGPRARARARARRRSQVETVTRATLGNGDGGTSANGPGQRQCPRSDGRGQEQCPL